MAHGLEKTVDRAVSTGALIFDEVADIVAAGKAVRAALDDDGADALVALGSSDGIAHVAIHLAGQCVLLVGAVEGQGQYALATFNQQMIAHGHSSVCCYSLSMLARLAGCRSKAWPVE